MERRRWGAGSTAVVGMIVAAASLAVVGFRGSGEAVELEGSFMARGTGRDHWKNVNSQVLVKDLKTLLDDVEHSIKQRREKRTERAKQDGGKPPGPVTPDQRHNLDDVDHIMDGLQELAGGHGSRGGDSSDSSEDDRRSSRRDDDHRRDHRRGRDERERDRRDERRHRDQDRDRSRNAEHRLRTKHHSEHASRSHGVRAEHAMHAAAAAPIGKKIDPKKAAILNKMKALQAKIEGDFKSVRLFGKKAGYVPKPRMPQP